MTGGFWKTRERHQTVSQQQKRGSTCMISGMRNKLFPAYQFQGLRLMRTGLVRDPLLKIPVSKNVMFILVVTRFHSHPGWWETSKLASQWYDGYRMRILKERVICWVVPLPRLLVTTRIISCLGSGIPINLHLPLLLGRGTTQLICLKDCIPRESCTHQRGAMG